MNVVVGYERFHDDNHGTIDDIADSKENVPSPETEKTNGRYNETQDTDRLKLRRM